MLPLHLVGGWGEGVGWVGVLPAQRLCTWVGGVGRYVPIHLHWGNAGSLLLDES